MKTTRNKCTPLLALTLLVLASSCTQYTIPGDERPGERPGDLIGQNCDPSEVNYEQSILPLMQEYCIGCHNSNNPAGGYDYTDYDVLLASVANGSLIGSLESTEGFSPMPPGTTMETCAVDQLKAWIGTLDLTEIPIKDPIAVGSTSSDCDPDTVYFQNTILPLIVSSCATTGCHDQGAHKDGIILTDYHSIMTTGKIKPGDLSDSEFFEVLSDDDDDLMPPPPSGPLSGYQIEQIADWILQGALDNECHAGCDTTSITFSGAVWPGIQTYCTGCHTAGNPGGGVIIENYADLVGLSENGTLLGSVRYEPGYAAMPPNQPMDPCLILQLEQWISLGHPE